MRIAVNARFRIVAAGVILVGACLAPGLLGCTASLQKTASQPTIANNEHDPIVWGAVYPAEYQTWLATAQPRPAGKSLYKRGFDAGVTFDKLSEYPFMPLLFKGWGFGIDYNEPRGHWYMLIDQSLADPSRVKAGGACLTCKSSYAEDLYQTDKAKLFASSYTEARAMIPQKHRQLGATCIDCHDNATTALRTRRWTVDAALKDLGLTSSRLTGPQKSLMVCGQCHATYSVMKQNGKSVDVDFPWEGSTWGAISVEKIIANIEQQPERHEWTQAVTGMKLGFIRHPDVEFFTAGSGHAQAGVTCADCHMPDVQIDNKTVADHNLMSPLKRDGVACQRCHPWTPAEIRAKVLAIQQKDLGMLYNAALKTATAARLIQIANASLETSAADVKPAYDQAAAHYRQAFYRVVYMGAENSVGFHNPDEGARILTDAAREADAAASGLRALLAAKGVAVPAEVPLNLRAYLENRGVKHLGFERAQYIADPTGAAQKKWPASLNALLK